MSNSLDAILAQYEKNTEPLKSGKKISNEDRLKKYFTEKLPKGVKSQTKTFRILPSKDGGSPFTEVFYHEKELHTIIGNTQVIWSHNIEEASQNSIIPLLELDKLQVWKDMIDEDVYGICSDYVGRW